MEEKKVVVEYVGKGVIVYSEKHMHRWMCMGKML
jgi:hypothetical protein